MYYPPPITATKFYVRHRENYPETTIHDAIRRGFDEMGIEVVPYYWFEDIDKFEDLGPTVGIGGYIGDVVRGLLKLGCPIPENVDYPEQLQEYLGRKIWQGTIADVQRSIHPIFVKPVPHKLFTGFVWQNDAASRRHIVTQPDTVEVWLAEPVEFISEYRSFILHGEILDCRLYKGDWSAAPSKKVVEEATAKMVPHAPVAFCLDWGVTADGRTLLVEMNEAYSFGLYGLNPCWAAHMLSARWYQMTLKFGQTDK
jgi:hypothetical protein